MKTIHG